MKVMKDLEIRLLNIDFDSFHELITCNPSRGWSHARDKEERGALFGKPCICFEFNGEFIDCGSVGLTIFKRTENTLFVPNIVPFEKGQLGIEEYNQILDYFVFDVLDLIHEQGLFEYKLSDEDILLENIVDAQAYNLFTSLNALANKSTSALHPMDRNRWFEFIIATYNQDLEVDLIKNSFLDAGWSSDASDELAKEYGFGKALLVKYTS